jgi:hypothetical protein
MYILGCTIDSISKNGDSMNKSIYERLATDTTVNFTQWKSNNNFTFSHEYLDYGVNKHDTRKYENKNEYKIDAAVFMLEVIEAFMNSPIVQYSGSSFEAESRVIHDLEVFKDYMIQEDKKMILYDISWNEPRPMFDIKTDNDGNITGCEYEGLTEGEWIIRGVWLDGNEVSINDK